jgi:hypothetical protein
MSAIDGSSEHPRGVPMRALSASRSLVQAWMGAHQHAIPAVRLACSDRPSSPLDPRWAGPTRGRLSGHAGLEVT